MRISTWWSRLQNRRRKALGSRQIASSVEVLDQRIVLFAGDLDAAFGASGNVVTTLTDSETNPVSSHVLSDGRILVIGQTDGAINTAHRYNTDGSLDTTFGTNGVVRLLIAGSGPVWGSAVQADGKIVVAGAGLATYTARFNADGTLDTTYGNGAPGAPAGASVFSTINGSVRAVTLQEDGKLLMVGEGSDSDLFLARVNADGTLDTTFGTNGITTFDIAPNRDVPNDIVIDGAGRIVISGEGKLGGADTALIAARFDANGNLDTSFDEDGKVQLVLGTDSYTTARGMAIDSSNNIVLVGSTLGDLIVVRLNASGALDTTFNATGFVEPSVGANTASVDGTSVVIQADGKLLVATTVYDPNVDPITSGFGLLRLNADGTVDTTFSSDGQAVYEFDSPLESFNQPQVLLQADGKAVVVTAVNVGGITSTSFVALARIETDGGSPQPPTPGITVGGIPAAGLVTTEAGGTASFTLVLNTAPTADVTIPIAISDATEGTLTVTSVTFTTANWNVAQTVTVTGADDAEIDGHIAYSVTLGAATSTDADYNGLDLDDVALVNDDNESARYFRGFNSTSDAHFFTTSRAEFNNAVANGFRDETNGQAGFAVAVEQVEGSTPIYRLYNLLTGQHYYTSSAFERDFLVNLFPPPTSGEDLRTVGWRFEKEEGFLFETQAAGTTEIFRLYNTNSGVHLFTQDPVYKDAVLAQFPGVWVQHDSFGFAYAVAASGEVQLTSPPTMMASAATETAAANGEEAASDVQVASLVFVGTTSNATLNSAGVGGDANVTASAAIATDSETDELDEVWASLGSAGDDLDPWSV